MGECVIIFNSDKQWVSHGDCVKFWTILFSGFLAGECVKIVEHFFPAFLAVECVKNLEHFIFRVSFGRMCKDF